MGVALKVNMFVVLLQIGLCTGIQPLIGYNYGSGNHKRLKKIFVFTGIAAVAFGTTLTAIMVIARETIIHAFIDDAAVVELGIKMVIALQLAGPVIGILFLCINTLQGMGKALPSLVLTFCRQGLIFVPLILILNALFGLEGVIYAQCTADFISIILALTICLIVMRKLKKE